MCRVSTITPASPIVTPSRPRGLGRAVREEQPVEQQDQDRQGADEQSRDAGGQTLLRPDHEAIADAAEQHAADEAPADMDARERPALMQAQPGVHEGAGNEKPQCAAEERRNGADREGDADKGRAPDDIDAGKGQQDGLCIRSMGHRR